MAATAMKAISQRQVDIARAEAIRLCADAYAPAPVVQPDGPPLQLCYAGRISRASDKLALARIANDTAAIARLETGIAQLQAKVNAAAQAADLAAQAWVRLALAAGQPAARDEVYPPVCTCEACQANVNQFDHNMARRTYTAMLYDLCAPNRDTPPIIELVRGAAEKGNRDQLWTLLKRVLDAGEAYIDACRAAGVSPNWRLAMYPGGGWESEVGQ